METEKISNRIRRKVVMTKRTQDVKFKMSKRIITRETIRFFFKEIEFTLREME